MSTIPDRMPGRFLGALAFLSLLAGSLIALFFVPADAAQGEVQRLMYIHVATAWVGMLCFFVVFLMSILYLVQRKLEWDLIAASAAEIGVLFMALTLGLGSLWARPTWGVWWEWDPRLTTTALTVVVYVAYLIIRSMADDPATRARWSAAIGIIAFIQVPIVYLSVFWWRSLHQPPSSPRSMASEFLIVLLLNVAAFTILFVYLLLVRYHVAARELAYEQAGPPAAPGGDGSPRPESVEG